jgi:hypothetical protein
MTRLLARLRPTQQVEPCWVCTGGNTNGAMCRAHCRQVAETARAQSRLDGGVSMTVRRRRWAL